MGSWAEISSRMRKISRSWVSRGQQSGRHALRDAISRPTFFAPCRSQRSDQGQDPDREVRDLHAGVSEAASALLWVGGAGRRVVGEVFLVGGIDAPLPMPVRIGQVAAAAAGTYMLVTSKGPFQASRCY